MNRRNILLLGIVPLALLTGFLVSSSAQESKTAQEDSIREAIILYQIAKWDLNTEVYFLEIQSKDPSGDFLSRFKDIPKPVKKKSSSMIENSLMAHVVEKKAKKRFGVIFDQETIKWNSDSVVDVEGGYHCGGLCSASGIYHLERRVNRWSVTDFKISIIS